MLLVTSDNRLDHFLVEAKNQQPSISHVGHCSMCTKFHVYCHPGSPIRNRGWRQLRQDPGFGARVPTANFVFQQRGIETAGLIHFGEICGKHEVPLVAASNGQFILQHRRPKQGITEVPDWKVSDFPMSTTLCTKLHQLLRITSSRPQGTANLRWRVAVV